jgi:hypothetical protein
MKSLASHGSERDDIMETETKAWPSSSARIPLVSFRALAAVSLDGTAGASPVHTRLADRPRPGPARPASWPRSARPWAHETITSVTIHNGLELCANGVNTMYAPSDSKTAWAGNLESFDGR